MRRAATLFAIILDTAALSAAFWWYGSSYIVTWRATRAAGDRPFCISVAGSLADEYVPARSRQQLAFAHMWAGWTDYGGSMGPIQTTNHALLILADPPAVMNWSYRAMDFLNEPMLSNVSEGPKDPPHLASEGRHSCAPRRAFAVSPS